MRKVLIKSQRITPDTIRDIIKFLNENDFKFYVGYPSVIHALAATANRSGVTLKNQPRVILLSADNVTEFQLHEIVKYTYATITEHYGSVEGCGSASFCKHNVFHEDFEYGFLECVNPEVQEDRSVRGKIVSTGFANIDLPLIRYEIGDIVIRNGYTKKDVETIR